MDALEIKRKLRSLKRLEVKLRGECFAPARQRLTWDEFFSLGAGLSAKYTLAALLALTREQYRQVIDEYLYALYGDLYRGRAARAPASQGDAYSILGLSPGAGLPEIRSQFHSLVKQCHPDAGGDPMQFIAVFDAYKKLTAGLQ